MRNGAHMRKGSTSFGACEVRFWCWLFGNETPVCLLHQDSVKTFNDGPRFTEVELKVARLFPTPLPAPHIYLLEPRRMFVLDEYSRVVFFFTNTPIAQYETFLVQDLRDLVSIHPQGP